ncbi:hypothetical protein MSPP1_003338 [Malassezia sp. CBS 17886]|nr:hypothetical protein MSPP1_003338 [Malassezia sp. CBS 17886]
MDAPLPKALFDRVYDKRKAAALELERHVRESVARNERARVAHVVTQLCALLSEPAPSANMHTRNGGLIGLAGVAVALGEETAVYLEQMVGPVLACFRDADPKTRYFACEGFYNIAKVCKGEVLLYFNDVFDMLSRLVADSEVSVKNGAELLDRLFKDIVSEAAPHYVSAYQDVSRVRAHQDRDAAPPAAGGAEPSAHAAPARARGAALLAQHDAQNSAAGKTFSLARLVPLLADRMQVISPLTRNYLISWIAVLDSVPDLQLVVYLPAFLRALFQYLSDPNMDVRVATSEVLADFLREISRAAKWGDGGAGGCGAAAGAGAQSSVQGRGASTPRDGSAPASPSSLDEERPGGAAGERDGDAHHAAPPDEAEDELVWVSTDQVHVEYDTIFEILLERIASDDEETQATTLEWITEFVRVVPGIVIPFTARLISAILPCLAHLSPAIQDAARETNKQLFGAVDTLPTAQGDTEAAGAPTDGPRADIPRAHGALDPLDYGATMHALQEHLVDENEKTRVNALEWVAMLHRRSPESVLAGENGGLARLLRVLADPSEEVVLCNLRLLTQICTVSDAQHFERFLGDLLALFAADHTLLETWGSLIVRQLCAALDAEHVFCTLARILEHDADLEFASIMVQNLNLTLLAAPELAALRARLRALHTRESQRLFVRVYRCWCHNAVSTFCLCLHAQAYEHAYSLLRIFAEFDVSLGMLIQIDKLVQLLESPIFTSLRLQLLEPDAHPALFKCLYGVLMLLPQSSAFATLRNRLHAVNGYGLLPAIGRAAPSPALRARAASGSAAPDIGWAELLAYFRQRQARMEHVRDEHAARPAPADACAPAARDAAHAADVEPGRRRGDASFPFHSAGTLRSATAPLTGRFAAAAAE